MVQADSASTVVGLGEPDDFDDAPGGFEIGVLGITQLTSLLLAVAVVAGLSGFLAATLAQNKWTRTTLAQKKRRAQRVFLAGALCGLVAGRIVRGRRCRRKVVAAIARRDHRVRARGRFRAAAASAAARLLS